MPVHPPPHKQRSAVFRQKSAEPGLPIDLNSSTRSTDGDTGHKITRRAFLIDLVVDKPGRETADLLAHLGSPLEPLTTLPIPPTAPTSVVETDAAPRHLHEDATQRLDNLIEELVRTEKSYLSRIHALKTNYADRLRLFARDPYQQLIPPYEAKAMFANIEAIVPASAAFLTDLDAMFQCGRAAEEIGDVCLRHLKTLRTLDPYRTYLSKQDESQRLFQESLRKFPGFASFIESTKYQTTGIGNIGLRELLMEPVQRIPRYTLLWQTMAKCMGPASTQRPRLLEAIEIASRIARCEPDPQTVRATVMHHLERNIEDFPAKLFSNSRDFIDAIDVEDQPAEYPSSPSRPSSTVGSRPLSFVSGSTPSLGSFGSLSSSTHSPTSNLSHLSPLPCTLFLFNDKLVIVKRQSGALSGRKITGTDDVKRLVTSNSTIEKGTKKDKLSFRGEVDVLDVIATDVGNGDFHLFLERPPMDQPGRWSARPFRSYTTVHPPYSVSLDPITTRRDKLRFVHNLWSVQAQARSRRTPTPHVMASDEEIDLEEAGEPFARAKCFWNIWDRSGSEGRQKAKVLVQVDEDGVAPDLPLAGILLLIRLQPMSGGLCRFSYWTAESPGERVVISTTEVAEKIALTIHRFGIFKFRTGTLSCPTTPSSHRLRPSMLNLDAISRNLFGAGSVSIRGDAFSPSSKRRSQSIERSFEIESPLEDPLGLIAGAPYAIEMHQSEVDLNERLTEAKANSRSVASNAAVERAPESPIPITAPLRLCKTPPPVATLSPPQAQTPLALTIKPLPPAKDEWPIPTPQSPPVVTRPSGPRLAPQSPPPALSSSAPIGSAHTKLRIVSGGGRRISVGRETVPLKGGDENESPTSTPTIHVAAKRQHSSDHLTPRKRSPTRSPLQPLPPHELPDQQLSARHSSNRRSPGTLTPGRYVTAPRTASQTSTDLVDIEMADHPDLESAMQASSKKIHDALGSVKRLKSELSGLRRQIAKESKGRDLVQRLDRNGSLPRSPQRRHINRIADHDAFDSVSSRHSGRHEIDTIVMDECARGITSIAERVEANLRQAQADGLQASSLVSRLLAERDQAVHENQASKGQTHRSKETIEMLQRQLGDAQIELDVIYEAFNTELDGLFSDAQLPETEAFQALQDDLRSTKAQRNSLELENKRLKRELEEANLKREQWARMLRSQGFSV